MTGLFVRVGNGWHRLRRWFRAESGLTIIEYGVFAAFVVLILVGVALWVGPELKDWMVTTFKCIMDKTATGCDRGGPIT